MDTFERGVVVRRPDGQEIILPQPMAEKWRSLGGPTSLLGCPKENPTARYLEVPGRPAPALEYSSVAFDTGQIIYNPIAGAPFYISEHFEKLRRRFEQPALYTIGVPASDPMSGEGIAEWQLFQVPGNKEYNALEMRINPPTLYVTRHPVVSPVWFPIDPASTELHRDTQDINNWVRDWAKDRTATPKWETFACQTINGPCNETRYDNVPNLPNAGAVCDWKVTPWGPPEWQPLLYAFADGEQWIDRGVDAAQLHRIVQEDPLRALEIMQYQGRPNGRDWGSFLRAGNRPIYWYSSTVEGIVTNSKFSGTDLGLTHRPMSDGWELGDPEQVYYRGNCNPIVDVGQLCNDWNLYMKLDPEYDYYLAESGTCEPWPPAPARCLSCCSGRFPGSFSDSKHGTLGTEIEQWQIPGGYRPEIGDRIVMSGRWIIDCGHDSWSPELHPIETFVTSHIPAEPGSATARAKVIVTSAWIGGERTPDGELRVGTTALDIYPPVRPSPDARLIVEPEQSVFGIQVDMENVPSENPNYVRLTLRMTADELFDRSQGNRTGQGNYGDLFYLPNRRMIGTFKLRWQ